MHFSEDVRAAVRGAQRVFVLTGAGMSAESGLATFRDEDAGLWSQFRPVELATPEAWKSDQELVWAWYQWRAGLVRAAQPNAGHRALALLSGSLDVTLSTQNVDDLHERAGSRVDWHLHGSLFDPWCSSCGARAELPDPPSEVVDRLAPPQCSSCGGAVRPGVVWFGEIPRGIEESIEAACAADVVLLIGTSGSVYPAASIAPYAKARGVAVIEVNPQPSGAFVSCRATAAQALPALVGLLMS